MQKYKCTEERPVYKSEEEEKEALGRGLYTLNKRILPYLQKKEVHKWWYCYW